MQDDQQEQHEAPPSTNIFGWKWSKVSLVIIVVSLLFLVVIGPRDPGELGEEAVPVQQETADSVSRLPQN